MWWISFLHLYQPASIESFIVEEAVKKSYRRIVQLLEKKTELKMTMNISGCLLERLNDEAYFDLINRIKKIIESGRLELVGSASFHGFLALLPEDEIEYQIKHQEEILKKLFNLKRPKGFFIPEMAYHPKITKIVKKLGYEWLILDEISYNEPETINNQRVYKDKESGLKIIFRQKEYSGIYPPDKLKELRRKKDLPSVIINAVDGELYGLRHLDPKAELERIVFWSNLKTATISEFIDKEKELKDCSLRKSSWESTIEELEDDNPYALWSDKNNEIHKKLWNLANFIISAGLKDKEDKGYSDYRWHLDRGLASCWFWWASAYDFSRNYGPLAWSPDQIERGLNDLIRAVRSLNNIERLEDKIIAENLVADLRKIIWQTHWQNYWSKVNNL